MDPWNKFANLHCDLSQEFFSYPHPGPWICADKFTQVQGLSERMAKVICTAGVFIFTKSQFSLLFLLQNWRQITPPAHPGPLGSFSALPQRWRCPFMREEEGKGRSPRETSAQLSAILDNLGDLETRSPNKGEDY